MNYKNIKKTLTLILIVATLLLLTSCKKNIDNINYSGVWNYRRDIVMVGGEDTCKYDFGVGLLKFDKGILSYSEIIKESEGKTVDQEMLNSVKDSYNDNFIKILKTVDNEMKTPYDDLENEILAMKLYSFNIKKDLIEVRFINDRSDEDVLISEVYIKFTKTNLNF